MKAEDFLTSSLSEYGITTNLFFTKDAIINAMENYKQFEVDNIMLHHTAEIDDIITTNLKLEAIISHYDKKDLLENICTSLDDDCTWWAVEGIVSKDDIPKIITKRKNDELNITEYVDEHCICEDSWHGQIWFEIKNDTYFKVSFNC